MAEFSFENLRPELIERREHLSSILPRLTDPSPVLKLLHDIDAALGRLDAGVYGICESCHGHIENERLAADPLARVCLDCLSADQQRALEHDLDLASRIQATLLPANHARIAGWQIDYTYQPAGPVSGDYCDWIASPGKSAVNFVLGDVSGKGLAASLLVGHLHGIFHGLATLELSVSQLLCTANRLLCESSLPTHYATLICGRAFPNGDIELCNAGHMPALVLTGSSVTKLFATGIPIGLFTSADHTLSKMTLGSGEALLLFTDGLSEAWNGREEFGLERVYRAAVKNSALASDELMRTLVRDIETFQAGEAKTDDVTMMVLRRAV